MFLCTSVAVYFTDGYVFPVSQLAVMPMTLGLVQIEDS